MIPELNQSGVLPPYDAAIGPTSSASMAPYEASMTEFVRKYATSPERIAILRGLLDFRKKLLSLGINTGHQWLDGSFVEDVEKNRGCPPNDIDIVTFALRPQQCATISDWKQLHTDNIELFESDKTKEQYRCDAYYVDLQAHPLLIVELTRFWFGLFSHQKESSLWKGMIKISLQSDDGEALKLLKEGVGNAQKA